MLGRLRNGRSFLYFACYLPLAAGAAILAYGLAEQEKLGFTLRKAAYSAVFTPDSKYIGTGGFDETALLDIEAHKLVDRFARDDNALPKGVEAGEFKTFAVSADGKYVASGGGMRRPVRVLDFRTGRVLRSFDTNRTDVRALAFSHDGKWLAAGTAYRLHAPPGRLYGPDLIYEAVYEIWLWDLSHEGDEPVRILGHEAPVQGMVFTLNDNQIVSVSNDWTLRLWDVATQREIRQSWTPRVFGPPFGFPAAGVRFGASDRGAGEWLDVARLNRISLTLSADGEHLVCGRSVWDAHKLELEYFVDGGRLWTDFDEWQTTHGRRPATSSEAFGMIATNSVGGALTGDGRRLVYRDKGENCIFDVVAKKLLFKDQVFSNGASVFALDVSPDGRYALAAGSGDPAGFGGAPVARVPCQLYLYRLPPP